jgi:hypothetical protein
VYLFIVSLLPAFSFFLFMSTVSLAITGVLAKALLAAAVFEI